MQKRYFIGRISCEEGIKEFDVEYYVIENSDLYAIELVKESEYSYGTDRGPEVETSFPISDSRGCVERLAKTLMHNSVTPETMYECLDDMYESWYEC